MFSPTPKLWNEPHIQPLFFSKNQAEAGQKGEEADALRCTAHRYKKRGCPDSRRNSLSEYKVLRMNLQRQAIAETVDVVVDHAGQAEGYHTHKAEG